jgi:hypothetical protein
MSYIDLPSSGVIRKSSIPLASSAIIVSIQTSTTGSNWVSFSSQACNALDIVNVSGFTIEYRRGGTGDSIPIPTGSARLVVGITNASDISLRRVDLSNTQITITSEALTA